jgi:hypothetical protein
MIFFMKLEVQAPTRGYDILILQKMQSFYFAGMIIPPKKLIQTSKMFYLKTKYLR